MQNSRTPIDAPSNPAHVREADSCKHTRGLECKKTATAAILRSFKLHTVHRDALKIEDEVRHCPFPTGGLAMLPDVKRTTPHRR